VDRILAQSCRIVTVRVATGDRVQALAQKISDGVFNLPRLPGIHDAARQPLGQAQPIITGLQQNRTAIGTAVPLVELRYHGAAKKVGKQHSLRCVIVGHAKASRVIKGLVVQPFYHDRGFCLSEIVNFLG
jgi:hypothetical protein